MRDRWYRKGSSKKYDPQVGAAALANSAIAERTEAWNRDYFDKYVGPAMQTLAESTKRSTDQLEKVSNLEYEQAQQQAERYKKIGIPAEDRYYSMVDKYSAPEEQETQARAAIGDVRTAAAGQQQQQQRQLRSLGIDPTSGAALSARSDAAFQNAALEAGAATRAREAAKTLGMGLASEAAGKGSSILTASLGAAGGAGAAAGGGASAAQGGANVTSQGASGMNQGFGTAQRAYGQNLDAYTSLRKTAMETAGPSALASIAQMGTQLGSAALTHSDRRLKKHAQRVMTLAHDIGVWMFRYIWEPDSAPLRFGYMADEVERVFPAAVLTDPRGYKMVDYGKVPV